MNKIFKISWRKIWIIVIFFIAIIGVLSMFLISYSQTYDKMVLPGVYLGDFYIGEIGKEELVVFLQNINDKLSNDGIVVRLNKNDKIEKFIIYPTIISGDNKVDLIKFNVEEEVNRLLSYGKYGNIFIRTWSTLQSRLFKPTFSLRSIDIDEIKLSEVMEDGIEKFESNAIDANLKVESLKPLKYEIVSSSPGIVFERGDIVNLIINDLSNLVIPEIELSAYIEEPVILESMVVGIEDKLERMVGYGNLELNYTDIHTKREFSWKIDLKNLADWLELQLDDTNNISIGLSSSSTIKYLKDNVSLTVDVEAKNAKFKIGENGKVEEFQGSRPGISLDIQKTYEDINKAIKQRSLYDEGVVNTVPVSIVQVEPEVKTEDINEMGIEEIIGIGYSTYIGSPGNRIKNIANAIFNKLNGILIAPDETFSLLKALKPFTIEGGYLPELVIKGDKIKPEIGGGLCQMGTTMFRTAMNTGLPIVQRSNHSLVVSYYNDPRNGNPGTDASIYDPAPDVKFKNDTGHYILLTTDMEYDTGLITFTMWGTSDGRNGHYSAPIVLNWIPTGPTKEIETTDLALGERKCQERHPGANAKFTYTVDFVDGTKKEVVFESYYRPLPEICLVGIEEKTEDETENKEGELEGGEEVVFEVNDGGGEIIENSEIEEVVQELNVN